VNESRESTSLLSPHRRSIGMLVGAYFQSTCQAAAYGFFRLKALKKAPSITESRPAGLSPAGIFMT
jgi:hypothetical protein